MRVILNAAKCSQMSDPKHGTGNGGDRCTEATAAMIFDTYKMVASGIPANHTTESVMYYFTQMLNKGSYTSALENVAWIAKWMKEHSQGKVEMTNILHPTFEDIKSVVDGHHLAVLGFSNYAALKLANGSNPYKWIDHHQVGHVVLLVGYDDTKKTVIVHDPLRADPSGMPADYAWGSFAPAGFYTMSEALGDPVGQTFNSAFWQITQVFGGIPTDQVLQFCNGIDAAMQIGDPNAGDSGGPFGWLQDMLSNVWHAMFAILFRATVILLGLFILLKVFSRVLDDVHSTGEGVGTPINRPGNALLDFVGRASRRGA